MDYNALLSNLKNYLDYLQLVEGDRLFINNDHIKQEFNLLNVSNTNNNISKYNNEIANVKELFHISINEENDLDWKTAKTLQELYSKIKDCQKCPFGKSRTHFVFGEGNPNAEVMIIGEAPGADEDKIGKPFVGKAGQLLTKIIESINFKRDEVYIANIVKCRPPNNKTPVEDEWKECLPYLIKQIELIKPKIMLLLGAVPFKALLGSFHQITKERGQIFYYNGIPTIPTFHPAYLLRNPAAKKDVWIDVQLLRKIFDEQKNIQ
ncbi:MAG TPA: uracil-DNA glycosylase [Bacteroidota bacterium]|nr:uracil-DNA glycosylase [Candidatus Kapabacteria bacterium]HRS01686.1 uracil-DNA glycosylase [Bacteroidota bacterium]